MMLPLLIEGHTRRLGPPTGIDASDCMNLAIRDNASEGGNVMWSAWEPSPQEARRILENGDRIYLGIYGMAHPMVTIGSAPCFSELELDAGLSAMVEKPNTDACRMIAIKMGEGDALLKDSHPEIAQMLSTASTTIAAMADMLDRQQDLIEDLNAGERKEENGIS